MSNEPKPCPCCDGCNIVFVEYTPNKGAIICHDCNLKLVAYGDHTGGWRKNATEKWNARPERTCRNVSRHADSCNHFECSECGGFVEDSEFFNVIIGTRTEDSPWNYCPICGAKVVD